MSSHPRIRRPRFQWPIRPRCPDAPDLAGRRDQLRARARDLNQCFRRLTQLSWPRRYPLVQFPNAPLILAFLGGQAAHFLHGTPHSYASAVSYLAMIVWAYEELTHGVNLFRRLLGLGYSISTLVHLAVALHR
jgi:hypothetical protein